MTRKNQSNNRLRNGSKVNENQEPASSDKTQSKKKEKKTKNNKQESSKTHRENELNSKNPQVNNGKNKSGKNENSEIKKGDNGNDLEKTSITQGKNRKIHDPVEAHKSDVIKKIPCVFKKRDAEQSSNDKRVFNNEYFKESHHERQSKGDCDTRHKNNHQLKNNSHELSEKHVSFSKCSDDNRKKHQTSKFIHSQNRTADYFNHNAKNDDIKTMVIKRGKNSIKTSSDYSNQNYQYTNVSKLRHQGQNKYYNKNYWNFHGHDDQITSYKNHEDDLNENDHAMNIERPIIYYSQKNKDINGLISINSEYNDSEFTRESVLNNYFKNITFDSLSDSTFIDTNKKKLHDDTHSAVQIDNNVSSSNSITKFKQNLIYQNYFKMNSCTSPSFENLNKFEENVLNKYDFKNVDSEDNFEKNNIGWTTQINSDPMYKTSNKNPSTEVKEINYNEIRPIVINNPDRFIAYFDKLWEDVMQTISGY